MTSKPTLPKFCSAPEAAELLKRHGDVEYAVVANPSYVHPPFDLYPLAPVPALPLPRIAAVVCDMDGTTTTTEPLCIHSLEYMIRRITGRMTKEEWPGLDHELDYPNIIGNSTTRHVEYLLQTYAADIRALSFYESLASAARWTIEMGKDRGRLEEAVETARLLNIDISAKISAPNTEKRTLPPPSALVRGAIEIYYARYHEILGALAAGQGEPLAREILGARPGDNCRLVEPMPGAAFFLLLLKGAFDATDTAKLYDALAPRLATADHGRMGARSITAADLKSEVATGRTRFLAMAANMRQRPVPVAVVTSSIRYEADIVLGEVFAAFRAEIAQWPLAAERREQLIKIIGAPINYYDAVVTATDSSEIRLKPHRDLYSIALHKLGIPPEDFDKVIGLEDSESGLIAIRAAGIGMAIAVPFAQTTGHNLQAAAKICPGGLPELMFRHGCCVA